MLQTVAEEIHNNLIKFAETLPEQLLQAEEDLKKAETILAETPKGDASENEPLIKARQNRDLKQARLEDLKFLKRSLQVVPDLSKYNYTGQVNIYSTVQLDRSFKGRDTFRIYAECESILAMGILSANTPVAKRLLHKTVGDTIFLNNGDAVKILDIY